MCLTLQLLDTNSDEIMYTHWQNIVAVKTPRNDDNVSIMWFYYGSTVETLYNTINFY